MDMSNGVEEQKMVRLCAEDVMQKSSIMLPKKIEKMIKLETKAIQLARYRIDRIKQQQQLHKEIKICMRCGRDSTYYNPKRGTTYWHYSDSDSNIIYCQNCYNNAIYHYLKFQRTTKWRLPSFDDIIREYKIRKLFTREGDGNGKPKSRLKSWVTTETCKSAICIEQQERVREEHPRLRYTQLFQHYKFCKNCRTFWPRDMIFCNCCSKKDGRLKTKVAECVRQRNIERRKKRREERRLAEEKWFADQKKEKLAKNK